MGVLGGAAPDARIGARLAIAPAGGVGAMGRAFPGECRVLVSPGGRGRGGALSPLRTDNHSSVLNRDRDKASSAKQPDEAFILPAANAHNVKTA
jgi:hypothetical protein